MKWLVRDNQNIADILVEVYGRKEEELFENILAAFTNIITEVKKVKEEKETPIKITGKNLSTLILNFINQLIYLKDTSLLLFKWGVFNLTYTEKGYSLYSLLRGQKISKDLPIKTDIKALALHKFKVEKNSKGYKVCLVFDI
ncbi:hypothetical protein A3C98_02030 [Candidatus Roizmanbacteria bacterium RIFCSPHIGHO2_02_FULL_37_15]|uniref:Archease domain-containing protein n=1 Tax=Candidatus Roizmanbacteria bacterium RIFCSPLOWO2_01_FULL_37_16 TaxID=1802058 RepID=A0A1F7IMY2_9BACT|nr:MAG: hypothetical protein A2859_05630 [Candidatus Roizmanbacteria bacterium RIFCSPHIGHO2_01_FULL_37_16b]OGK20519.1 MAG: hypothetical protein A3C98_02030 [Candidatus Roizmanbacteria bacterium RIFCSPHIGHO2_02_FULL_37_15]OGK32213.1 MAG: hypothetical protein A3F57_01490 [Candidatus Roizmanbacteria bacterium RIFCSPHIGHO2_12_FULL_36_11]OGK44673.1 MAG: hypothetical protein A3B40_02555 [Candidatus Roizmanbacteria bacterium RIFCSPLOWO2_01_FULL_37_16]OGK55795.1 MAG: hypothetical protein A3I50_02210 [C